MERNNGVELEIVHGFTIFSMLNANVFKEHSC